MEHNYICAFDAELIYSTVTSQRSWQVRIFRVFERHRRWRSVLTAVSMSHHCVGPISTIKLQFHRFRFVGSRLRSNSNLKFDRRSRFERILLLNQYTHLRIRTFARGRHVTRQFQSAMISHQSPSCHDRRPHSMPLHRVLLLPLLLQLLQLQRRDQCQWQQQIWIRRWQAVQSP